MDAKDDYFCRKRSVIYLNFNLNIKYISLRNSRDGSRDRKRLVALQLLWRIFLNLTDKNINMLFQIPALFKFYNVGQEFKL